MTCSGSTASGDMCSSVATRTAGGIRTGCALNDRRPEAEVEPTLIFSNQKVEWFLLTDIVFIGSSSHHKRPEAEAEPSAIGSVTIESDDWKSDKAEVTFWKSMESERLFSSVRDR